MSFLQDGLSGVGWRWNGRETEDSKAWRSESESVVVMGIGILLRC